MLVGLDTTAIISKTKNQNLPDLIDLETEWANKKKEKAKRHWQRKINLVQVTSSTADSAQLSPIIGDVSISGTLSSPVAGGASSGGTLLSFIIGGAFAGDTPLSLVIGSTSADGASSSSVAGGAPTDDAPLSPIADCSLSPIANSSLLSLISSGDLLSPMSPTSFLVLPLSYTLSCAYHSSLPFR